MCATQLSHQELFIIFSGASLPGWAVCKCWTSRSRRRIASPHKRKWFDLLLLNSRYQLHLLLLCCCLCCGFNFLIGHRFNCSINGTCGKFGTVILPTALCPQEVSNYVVPWKYFIEFVLVVFFYLLLFSLCVISKFDVWVELNARESRALEFLIRCTLFPLPSPHTANPIRTLAPIRPFFVCLQIVFFFFFLTAN